MTAPLANIRNPCPPKYASGRSSLRLQAWMIGAVVSGESGCLQPQRVIGGAGASDAVPNQARRFIEGGADAETSSGRPV